MQFCIFLYHQNQKIRKKRDFSFNNFSTTKLITMVEVEEIELDLGLSIGGSFRKPVEKPKPVFGSDGGVSDSDPRDGMQRVDSQSQLQVKREVQALRRMEAKRKREQKKGPTIDPVGDSEPECQRLKTGFIDGVTNVSWTAPFSLQPQQYATVQYVPLNNGLPLPCWFASEKNVGGLEGFNGGDGKVKSNGSSRCSSSAVSDYQSSSREDGGSTDSRSHSANSFAEPIQLNIKSQPELSSSFHHPIRSHQCNNNIQDNRNHNNVTKETQTQSNIMQLQTNPMKLKEEAKGTQATNDKAIPMSKLVTQMPYVSAKGNGPNGKTVNGFLYRYSKSEVSIVCVCHGSTFSPAEFVQHAGGTDISHPLRHITVIPYAFG